MRTITAEHGLVNPSATFSPLKFESRFRLRLETVKGRRIHYINVNEPFFNWYPFCSQVAYEVDAYTNKIILSRERMGRELHRSEEELLSFEYDGHVYDGNNLDAKLSSELVENFNREVAKVAEEALGIKSPFGRFSKQDVDKGFEAVDKLITNLTKSSAYNHNPIVALRDTDITDKQVSEVYDYVGNILTMLSVMRRVVA